jgi:ankyrin repeat protein
MTRLLDAGASPTVVDDSGKTPFHVWDPYGFEPGTELLEALVRLFIRAGLDINTTDEGGHNVLHANVGKPGQLEAILRTADGEALDRALRATTHRGCTPVMEALRTGEEDGANTLLQFCAERYGFSLEGQDMDIQHLVAESPMSAASIRRVFDLGLCVRLGREESPLHQLQLRYWPSLDCVRALKALFPQSCSTTINEKLPLDKYLNRSITTPFHGSLAQFQTVVQELASLGVQEIEARPLKAAAWDYFTTTVLMLARSTEKEQNGDLVQEVVDAAVRCLITLGYLEAYELTTGKSAVTQMLGFLNPNQLESMADVWPWSSESIALAIEKTHEWTQFDRSRNAPLLLRAAFVSSENRVVQSMLDRGLDLHRIRGARSCLEEIFRLPAAGLDAGKQSLFCILLDHVKPSLLDHLAFSSGQLGLIHQPAAGDSAWVMNELMRRGADPNLQTGPAAGSQPAMVYHLNWRRFDGAKALLYSGADPTNQDATGADSALAAAASGCVWFHAELAFAEEQFSWRVDWQRTCTVGTHSGVTALHLSAASGHINCLRFYLERRLIHDVDSLDSQGVTPLVAAAHNGQSLCADYLCKKGARVDFQCPDGQTALHYAVTAESLETVNVLLRHGARSQPDFDGETPVIRAYEVGNQAIIQVLQQSTSGAVVDPVTAAPQLSQGYETSQQQQKSLARALEHAIVSGNLDLCRKVHDAGCHLDIDLHCGGCSPLILSASRGRFDILRWLLENGATATKVSCQRHGLQHTPLHIILGMTTGIDAGLLQLSINTFTRQGGDIFNPIFVDIAACSGNMTALNALLARTVGCSCHGQLRYVYLPILAAPSRHGKRTFC